jgi:hypothetical protein
MDSGGKPHARRVAAHAHSGSCLLSCSHPAPVGGFAAGLGRQGSHARGFVTPDNGAIQLRRVLIPIDREPRPTYALRATWDIVRMLGAQGATLQLLHVGSDLDPSSVDIDPGTWSTVEHSSRAGEVVEQILAAADEGSVDLIHGDRGASGLFGCAARQHDRTRGPRCTLPGARVRWGAPADGTRHLG